MRLFKLRGDARAYQNRPQNEVYRENDKRQNYALFEYMFITKWGSNEKIIWFDQIQDQMKSKKKKINTKK